MTPPPPPPPLRRGGTPEGRSPRPGSPRAPRRLLPSSAAAGPAPAPPSPFLPLNPLLPSARLCGELPAPFPFPSHPGPARGGSGGREPGGGRGERPEAAPALGGLGPGGAGLRPGGEPLGPGAGRVPPQKKTLKSRSELLSASTLAETVLKASFLRCFLSFFFPWCFLGFN